MAERHRCHFPSEGLGGRGEPDVDHATLSDPASDQLRGGEALAGTELELAQVDRPAAQPDSFGVDLPDPAGAHEDVPALHGDHEAVDSGRAAARSQYDIDHATHISPVCSHERSANEPRDVDNTIGHW